MMLRYVFRIVLPYVNTDSFDYHACAIGVTRETRYTSTDKRLLINNKTIIDMKHQIYALTTALVITIIGLIVTIDYFNGAIRDLQNTVALKASVSNLSEDINRIIIDNTNLRKRIMLNENRIRCFGTTIYGSDYKALQRIEAADVLYRNDYGTKSAFPEITLWTNRADNAFDSIYNTNRNAGKVFDKLFQ